MSLLDLQLPDSVEDMGEGSGFVSVVRQHRLAAFVALSIALSWACWAPLIASAGGWIGLEIGTYDPAGVPLVMAAIASMTVAAAAIAWTVSGPISLNGIVAGLLRRRTGVRWFLIALLLPPCIEITAFAVYALAGGPLPMIGLASWQYLFDQPANLLMPAWMALALPAGIGFALQLLAQGRSRIVASLALAAYLFAWFLPFVVFGMLASPAYPAAYWPLFAIWLLPAAFLALWLFDSSKGSGLAAALFLVAGFVSEVHSPADWLAYGGDTDALLIGRILYCVAAAAVVMAFWPYFRARGQEATGSPEPAAALSRLPVDASALLVTFTVVAALASLLFVASVNVENMSLPAPTGPFKVGKATYDWVDPARADRVNGTAVPRELMVYVWYPADVPSFSAGAPGGIASGPTIEKSEDTWMDERTAGILNNSVWARVRDHTYAGARVAGERGRYPVIMASHCSAGSPLFMTSLAADLASHGYVVVGVSHPHVSWANVYPDGRTTFWDADFTAASIDWANGTPDQVIAGFDRFGRYEDANRTGDLAFALDRLAALDAADPLSGRLDLARVGAVGNSNGGAAAVALARNDSRVLAAANLNGPWWYSVTAEPAGKPVLTITGDLKDWDLWDEAYLKEVNKTRAEADAMGGALAARRRALYDGSPTAYFVTVNGTNIYNYDDEYSFSYGENEDLGGPLDGDRARTIRNAYVLAFFDRYLNGVDSPLLRGDQRYPEASFEGRVDGRSI